MKTYSLYTLYQIEEIRKEYYGEVGSGKDLDI